MTLKKQPAPHKPPARGRTSFAPAAPALQNIGQVVAAITLGTAALVLLLWASGIDAAVARWAYAPTSGWAWFLREYGTWPGAAAALAGLGVCLVPGAWRRWPVVYKSALSLVIGAVLGAGLFNQVIIQNLTDRPRPRESVLLEAPAAHTLQSQAGFSGNSLPSGHAGMALVLVAPFFGLVAAGRRRLAYGVLAVGLASGALVGAGRVVLGAHFVSDIVAAAGVALLFSFLAHVFSLYVPRVPVRVILVGFALALAALVLGNRFTTTLVLELPPDFSRATLPCPVVAAPAGATETDVHKPTLRVGVQGYGAPITNLQLRANQGVVSLDTRWGVYHSLSCTADLITPPGWGE